uniref:Carboxylic ester hydrolase (EC) n=1 Tax=Ganoderma boninense TaxID=34458 RepID=A0A5K1JUC6_9APHY|nr:Carboxylic ester hydrolase (EC [Ganoderma boninense]
MPRVPSVSPVTGNPVPPNFIHTAEAHFVDNAGRTVLLRGINLSGADKAPGWGFNMLRYVITWEALEHAGPGKYDYEFMDYTIRVLRKIKEYGFRVYLDPHQDIWSRFSGGSGAPYWTLPACGINPRNFTATGTAIIHSEYPSTSKPTPEDLPAMIWSTNYGRLASQTLFTLFFAGREFAPRCIIDGQNIQDYLQSHFIDAVAQLAQRIRDNASDLLDECILGWDSMNEPAEGFCGYEDLNKVPTKQGSVLKKGPFPSPAQSLRLGMGAAQTVDHWVFSSMGPKKDKTVTINPRGQKMWADPATESNGVHPKWGWKRDPGWELGTCIWALHDVWDVDSGEVLLPYYFRQHLNGDELEFVEDFWRPHWEVFSMRIRELHPEAILFVAPPVFVPPPQIDEQYLKGRCCYSTHYYDGLTLVSRHWSWYNADALGLIRGKYSSPIAAAKIGERAIRKSIQEQLGYLKADADILGAYPTIIGEIGIPYDMDGKKAYGYTDGGKYKGDFSSQQKAMDASMNAADGPNVLNYTLWNYCPDNSHQWGDNWDLEDLSVWSADDLRVPSRFKMGANDSSSAFLLKKGQVATVVRSAAASSLSLNTLSPGEAPADDDTVVAKGTALPSAFADWDNIYDFLTDGTRAPKAFVRPFPAAVVGIPTDIQFDIAKSEFKLTVQVRPEDAPRREKLGLAAPSGSPDADEAEAELPTEIYVPLVHYATDKLLEDSQLAEQEQSASPASGSVTPSVADEPLSTSTDPLALPRSSGDVGADQLRILAGASPLLALDVEVSEGRWAVEAQTLKWWYPVPSSGSREYTITIKRAGGVIKTTGETGSSDPCSALLDWCAGGCNLM